MEVCNLTNLRVLIWNMTIIFKKIFAIKFPNKALFLRNKPRRHFWSQSLEFWGFFGTFCNQTVLRVTKAFLFENIQYEHFGPKFRLFFFFWHILQLGKFEGAYLKYDKMFLKFNPKNTQIRDVLYRIYWFLLFPWNFEFIQFLECWFQIWE